MTEPNNTNQEPVSKQEPAKQEPVVSKQEPVKQEKMKFNKYDSKATLADTEETPVEDKAEKKLFAGKYKTIEDLEKGYGELNKKLSTKETPNPDNAPLDDYELQRMFQENGLEPVDPTEHKDVYERYNKEMKEHGFSKKQRDWMMKEFKAQIDIFSKQYGPEIDRKEEQKKLTEEFGSETTSITKGVVKWANSNLSQDVLTKPLTATAEGIKLLKSIYEQSNNNNPIVRNNDNGGAPSKADIQAEIRSIIANPDYTKGNKKSNELNKQVEELVSKLHTMK